LSRATAGEDPRRSEALRLRMRFREDALFEPDAPTLPPTPFNPDGVPIEDAELIFAPFASREPPVADYKPTNQQESGIAALRRTNYLRTYRLAQRLKRGSANPYEFVLRVNNHLRSDPFRYTEVPDGRDELAPLDEFIHDTHRGYCQHFAGAMALLLRMGGVPARVVTGFSPGGFRRKRGEWIVRDTDAHSWVEAYFDQYGWVTFDPTPPQTPARSQTAAIAPPEAGDEPEEEATADAADPAARRPEGPTRETPLAGGGGDSQGTPWTLFAAGVAGLLGLAAVAVLLVRRRRARTPPSAPAAADRALAELERALRRAGRPAPTGVTLTGLEKRLRASGEGATYLRKLRAVRYGPGAEVPTRADRAAFRRDLAQGLGWQGRLRALWALPPRLRD
jgi:transglutaminase-like putative cysteine protease